MAGCGAVVWLGIGYVGVTLHPTHSFRKLTVARMAHSLAPRSAPVCPPETITGILILISRQEGAWPPSLTVT